MSQQRINEIWRKAEIHRQSCRVGYPSEDKPFQTCECCDQLVHTEPFHMNGHTKEYEKYGLGYPLWFTFLKHCILLMFILVVTKCSIQIYAATLMNHHYCYGSGVDGSFMSSLKKREMMHMQPSQPVLHLRVHGNEELPRSAGVGLEHLSPEHKMSIPGVTSGQNEAKSPCSSKLIFLSFFQQSELIDNWFLKSIEFLAHLITLIYIRNAILKDQQYYDERICSASDFTLIISNIPKSKGTRAAVERLFKQEFNKSYGKSDSHIKEIIFIFRDEELLDYRDQKEDLEKKICRAERKDQHYDKPQYERDIRELDRKIEQRSREVRRLIDSDQIECDKVIVVLAYEKDKAQVLEQYHRDCDEVEYNKYFNHHQRHEEDIKIKECHEPNEFVWEYIDDSERDRRWRQFLGWIVTAVFLAVFAFLYYFVIKGKTKILLQSAKEENRNSKMPQIFKWIAYGVIFIASIGVVLFNKFVLSRVIKKIVKREKHGYVEKENLSYAWKYAMAMFFTTALMVLLIELFSSHEFYENHMGMIEDASVMILATGIFTPLVWVINPYNMLKKCKRDRIYGTMVRQKDANYYMEDYPYLPSKRYAEVFKLLWLAFLYAELIPLGAFIVLFSLTAYYFIDKYNFIKNVSVRQGVSGKIAIVALKSVDATLFLLPAGEFIFNLMLHKQFDLMSLILMILGLLYLLTPITKIIWKMNDEKFALQEMPYEEAQRTYRDTYMSLHPVYKYTHQHENEKHMREVRDYFEKKIKETKYYGAGRGKYYKDTSNQSDEDHKDHRRTDKKTFFAKFMN